MQTEHGKRWPDRMRELMRAKSLTVRDMESLTGIDYESLSKYTRGKVEFPRGGRLRVIAHTLGVSESDLLSGGN